MDFANIQAQLANLTSQLSQNAERTTMQSVPTWGVSYGQGYPTHLCSQFAANEDAWGYQGHNQSRDNMFSNTYNSDWRDYSNSMRWEPQPVQHEAYWQPYEEFYSQQQPPQPYAQPNSGSTIDCNQILDELISLFQGSQNQTKEAPQGEYWQPYEEIYTTPMQPPQPPPQQFQSNSSMPMSYDEILDVLTSLTQGSQQEEYSQPSEEFYQWPYAPSQPPPQSSQTNSSTSMDNDQILDVLTSLMQELQNQDKRVDKLKNQMGEIVEFMAQIQEQREFSNSNIVNSIGEFEIAEAITLGSAMEVGADLKTSKHSLRVDEELLIEEEEEDTPLPHAPIPNKTSIQGKVVPNPILSNPIPPNAPFPRRFLIPKEEESEKGIMEAFPKAQSDIPILGATNRIPEYVDFFEELCTPRRMIQEKEVAEKYQEFINEDIYETTKPKEVEFDDTGQVTTIIVNLAKCKVPETFKDVVFVIEFLSNKASKPSSPISNSFSINMVLILMIQAPTLEFKPLPDHFKYHLPFKDQLQAVGSNGK